LAANYGLDWPGIATLLAAVSGHLQSARKNEFCKMQLFKK
jgi:hypothetical protein